MQGDLTTPVQTTRTTVRVVNILIRRRPDYGQITYQVLDVSANVLDTVTIEMRPATVASMLALSGLRSLVRSDLEAAIGQALQNFSG